MKLLKKRKRRSGSRKPDPRSISSRNDGDLGVGLTLHFGSGKGCLLPPAPPPPYTGSRTLTGIILAPNRIEAGGAGSGTGTNDWGLGRRSGLPSFPRNLLQEAVRMATLPKRPCASWPAVPAKPPPLRALSRRNPSAVLPQSRRPRPSRPLRNYSPLARRGGGVEPRLSPTPKLGWAELREAPRSSPHSGWRRISAPGPKAKFPPLVSEQHRFPPSLKRCLESVQEYSLPGSPGLHEGVAHN